MRERKSWDFETMFFLFVLFFINDYESDLLISLEQILTYKGKETCWHLQERKS